MSNKAIKKLQPIFKALKKAEGILGKEMRDQIIRKLISGAMAEDERDFLQDQRRSLASAGLGMDRENYERFLEGKTFKRIKDKRIGKKNFNDL